MSIFKSSNPIRLTQSELQQAKLLLLEHLSHAEYHAACIDMYNKRITRLENYIATFSESADTLPRSAS